MIMTDRTEATYYFMKDNELIFEGDLTEAKRRLSNVVRGGFDRKYYYEILSEEVYEDRKKKGTLGVTRIKTTDYYQMSVDRLLVQPLKGLDLTTEEILLKGEGDAVIYYDGVEDMYAYKEERGDGNIKHIFETLNTRIAVILTHA